MMRTAPKNIDVYIAGFPDDVQAILKKLRLTIRAAAPDAEEKISYQIPTFYLKGNLVHFAAFKNHISFFPTSSGIEKFQNELSAYEGAKGTVRFPLNKPIPFDLISEIVRFRVKENLERAEVKRKMGTTMNEFDAKANDWDDQPFRRERAQAVAAAIRREVPLTKQMTALEYGCGTGLLSFCLQPDLKHITLADSSAGMLAVLAGKIAASGLDNLNPLKLDLVTDPLPAERYSLIYTLMTLHHIRETDLILRSFFTLLGRPGWLCIADLEKEDGSFHDPGFDGHHGFDRAALAAQLEQAGFTSVRFSACYEVPKRGRHYPLFLAVAEKATNSHFPESQGHGLPDHANHA